MYGSKQRFLGTSSRRWIPKEQYKQLQQQQQQKQATKPTTSMAKDSTKGTIHEIPRRGGATERPTMSWRRGFDMPTTTWRKATYAPTIFSPVRTADVEQARTYHGGDSPSSIQPGRGDLSPPAYRRSTGGRTILSNRGGGPERGEHATTGASASKPTKAKEKVSTQRNLELDDMDMCEEQ